MAGARDAQGRFAPKPIGDLSPGYARRLLGNLAKGKSRDVARGHGTAPRKAWQTAAVACTPRYEKALEVVTRSRRGEGFTAASKAAGIAPDTVLRYAGSAFEQDRRGRWVAKPTDRLVRRMRFLDARGSLTVEPANSKEASKLAAYHNAVQRYLTNGDYRELRRFARMRLRTRQKTSLPFLTDLATLERLGHAGELSFEDLYQR
jgi:hypothetical protein